MKKLWLDTETLGLDPSKYRLVQIAALYDPGNGGECLEFNQKCYWDDHKGASALALFTNSYHLEVATEELSPAKLCWNFLNFLSHARRANNGFKLTLCGHNPSFDLGHLKAFYTHFLIDGIEDFFEYHLLDTVSMAKILQDLNLLEYKQRLNLTALCERFGIKQENAHDALCDIKATRQLYLAMKQVLRNGNARN